jgi:Tetratricopeptide repeat.
MGKIIKFGKKGENLGETNTPKEKKSSIKKWVTLLITVITTFCTITGITVLTLSERDWQKIAEQYNSDGLELYNLGKYEEAILLYDKAIKLESKGIDDIEVCYYNRGKAYFQLGNYNKAIGDYTIAIGISPKSKYYSDRAVAYERIGENEKAALDNISVFTTIIE